MTVHCKLCKHSIKTIGPTQPKDVMEAMAKHLVDKHRDQSLALKQEVDTLFVALTTYLMIQRFVRIPPEETELLEIFTAVEQGLMTIFPEVKAAS